MSSWQDLEEAAPAMARLGRRLLRASGRAFLATARADGRPRVHPVCPALDRGRLFVCVIRQSPKCDDLVHRGWYVLHALPGPQDAEFWVEGRALPVPDATSATRIEVPDGDELFELDITRAGATLYEAGAVGLPIPRRRTWAGDAAHSFSAPVEV